MSLSFMYCFEHSLLYFQFLVLTGHALNLTFLQTGVTCWITTRLLSHLVKLNSLSQLKYLRYSITVFV